MLETSIERILRMIIELHYIYFDKVNIHAFSQDRSLIVDHEPQWPFELSGFIKFKIRLRNALG